MKYSDAVIDFESRFNPIIFEGIENQNSIIICPAKAKFSKKKLNLIISHIPERYARNGVLCEVSKDKASGEIVLLFQRGKKPESYIQKIDQINREQKFSEKCSQYKTVRNHYPADNKTPERDVCFQRFGIG